MASIHRHGLTNISGHDGSSAQVCDVNVIFVHGLRGHPRETWSQVRPTLQKHGTGQNYKHKSFKNFFGLKKGKESLGEVPSDISDARTIFWPEEFLAEDLPQARLWTYGYNADVIGLFQPNNKNSISQHGRDFAVKLERDINNDDPIVFVVHSLGGIVTKDALHRSESIRRRTKLIVFLGTPHRGSGFAGWAEIASNLASVVLQDSNKRLLKTLEVSNEVLDNIHDEFKIILSNYDIKIHSFQEARGISGLKGLDNKVVDDFSSKLDLAKTQETVESIDANHMDMARCSSKDDVQYRQIHGVLKQFIRLNALKRQGHAETSFVQTFSNDTTRHMPELPSEPMSSTVARGTVDYFASPNPVTTQGSRFLLSAAELEHGQARSLVAADGPVPHPKRQDVHIVVLSMAKRKATASVSSAENTTWLLESLRSDFPRARVCLLSISFREVVDGVAPELRNTSEQVLEHLRSTALLHNPGCPIIYICEEVAGIVFKEMMNIAYERFIDIWSKSKGVIFLATPHVHAAGQTLARHFLNTIRLSYATETSLSSVQSIEVISPYVLNQLGAMLQNSAASFSKKADAMMIASFYEDQRTADVPLYASLASTGLKHEKVYAMRSNPVATSYKDQSNSNYAELRMCLEGMIEAAENEFTPVTISARSSASLDIREKQCVQRLCTLDLSKIEAGLEGPLKGTLLWLKQNPNFNGWCTAMTPTLMYVTGYPGCGKTTLASHVVRSEMQNASPHTMVCWFFCSARSEQEQSMPCLFRTIIYQVVLRKRSLLKLVRKASDIRPTLFDSVESLWVLFISLIEHEKNLSFSIIVDAVDECDATSQKVFANSVLTLLRSRPNAPLRVLVTSRPNSHTSRVFSEAGVSHIPLRLEDSQDRIAEDVRLVIRERVQALVQRGTCSAELGVELENILAAKSEGTFLWVSLMLNTFEQRRLLSRSDVTKVKTLPQRLGDLYQDFLETIPADDRKFAAILLRTVACSTRPLTAQELSMLLEGITEAADNVQELSLTMTSIQALLHPLTRIQNDKVLLVHHSLKEYLLEPQSKLKGPVVALFYTDQEQEAYRLATLCAKYLTTDMFSNDLLLESWSQHSSPISPELPPSEEYDRYERSVFDFDLEDTDLFKERDLREAELWSKAAARYQLLDYAANSWVEHVTHCQTVHLTESLELVRKLCDPNAPYLANWSQYLRATNHSFEDLPYDLDIAVVTAYFGLDSISAMLTERDLDLSQHGQALYWAARKGNLETLQFLLKVHIERSHLTNQGCHVLQQSPLSAAAQHGHIGCVHHLLESRIFQINETDGQKRTALSYAAGGGYVSILDALLCEPDIDGSIPDSSGGTALHWAASAGSADGISRLMKHPTVQVNQVDSKGRTALSWAAFDGHTAVAQRLLRDKQVAVELVDAYGCSPLLYAVQNGHLSFVKVLVHSRRADLSATDPSGRNYISWASERRHENSAMLRYLLRHDKHGADRPDNDGWTPLSWTMNPPGYPENAMCLVHSGLIDVNRQDHNGRTALSFAVTYGQIGIMQILMRDRSVKANLADVDGRTPLSYAAANGNLDMAKLLLTSNETDVNAIDKTGKSPLDYAAENGHEEVRQLFSNSQST